MMEDAVADKPIVQGTTEWMRERLGKVTASRFADVTSEARSKADREKGKLSATARSYLLELVGEHITGQPQEPPSNWAMEWGTVWEPKAREIYSARTGLEVQQVGFITHPTEPLIGCSPDGLVGDEGGLEIKCPATIRVHLGYLLGDTLPKEHVAQVQGNMWLTDRKWWDFISYAGSRITGPDSLELAFWLHRVERDEKYIRKLERKVFAFRDILVETLHALKTGGRL